MFNAHTVTAGTAADLIKTTSVPELNSVVTGGTCKKMGGVADREAVDSMLMLWHVRHKHTTGLEISCWMGCNPRPCCTSGRSLLPVRCAHRIPIFSACMCRCVRVCLCAHMYVLQHWECKNRTSSCNQKSHIRKQLIVCMYVCSYEHPCNTLADYGSLVSGRSSYRTAAITCHLIQLSHAISLQPDLEFSNVLYFCWVHILTACCVRITCGSVQSARRSMRIEAPNFSLTKTKHWLQIMQPFVAIWTYLWLRRSY